MHRMIARGFPAPVREVLAVAHRVAMSGWCLWGSCKDEKILFLPSESVLSMTGSKEAASMQHPPLLDSCMEHSTQISCCCCCRRRVRICKAWLCSKTHFGVGQAEFCCQLHYSFDQDELFLTLYPGKIRHVSKA